MALAIQKDMDGYLAAIQASPINKAARASTSYTIWPDQKEAARVPYPCVILDPSADGGMPHTRAPGIICLPAHYPQEKLAETIRHELVHIDQRKNSEKWRKKLLDEGWTVLDPEEQEGIPSEWRERCRLNPDTLSVRFVAWGGRYVPLPLFERTDYPKLREIAVRWWDMEEEKLLSTPPSTYRRRYGTNLTPAELEHPYELFAYRQ